MLPRAPRFGSPIGMEVRRDSGGGTAATVVVRGSTGDEVISSLPPIGDDDDFGIRSGGKVLSHALTDGSWRLPGTAFSSKDMMPLGGFPTLWAAHEAMNTE